MARDSDGTVIWQIKVNGKLWKRAYYWRDARRLRNQTAKRWPRAVVEVRPY